MKNVYICSEIYKNKMMTLLEAAQVRHSVRRYTDRPIERKMVEQLQAIVDECNREGGLNIQLVVDDKKAFGSWLVHYGAFSGVRNYFALVGRVSDDLDERLGYYGERLVLEAQRMGLNTCWAALTYRKNCKRVNVLLNEKYRAAIALGYGATQGSSHKIKTVEQVSNASDQTPAWFRRGVECALLAPTAINQQKFRFHYNDDQTVTATTGLGFFARMDLGIAKYHFELGIGIHDFAATPLL